MEFFTARLVAVQEMPDLNAFVVVLAEGSDGEGERLELQRALSFNDQDRDLDQDTYSLSTSSGATHYGGVVAWSLDDHALHLTLSPKAAKALRINGSLSIGLTGSVVPDALEGAMRRVLGS